MVTIKRPMVLRDTLYYLSPESRVNTDRAAGALIGAVAVLMAQGQAFEESIALLVPLLPQDFQIECVPESWRDTVRAARISQS